MVLGYRHHRDFTPLNGARITTFSDLITATKKDNFSVQFQYNIAPNDVLTETTGSGSITQADSKAIVATGTTANSGAIMQTRKSVRYRPGHESYVQFTATFTCDDDNIGIENTYQRAGIFNESDGYFLGFVGEDFAIVRRRDGVDNITRIGEFNGDSLLGDDKSDFKPQLNNLNVFRIRFGWLGATVITFEIQKTTGEWIKFHTINYPSTSPLPSVNNPVLPFRVNVDNNGLTENISISTGSLNGGYIGEIDTLSSNRYQNYSNTKNIASGDGLVSVFTLRVKETYFGKDNLINISPIFAGILPVNNTIIGFIKNATLGGTPNYIDIDTENSVVEVDTSGTTVSGGKEVVSPVVEAGGAFDLRMDYLDIEIFPGETLTIAANTGNTGDVTMSLRWAEFF